MLLLAIGICAVALFTKLGGAIDVVLRENYASIVAAQNMKESAERMDSALFFTLAGEEERARKMYQENLPLFEENLTVENGNVTIHPKEDEFAAKLTKLHKQYAGLATQYFAMTDLGARQQMYFNQMLPKFTDIKDTAQAILEAQPEKHGEGQRQGRTT